MIVSQRAVPAAAFSAESLPRRLKSCDRYQQDLSGPKQKKNSNLRSRPATDQVKFGFEGGGDEIDREGVVERCFGDDNAYEAGERTECNFDSGEEILSIHQWGRQNRKVDVLSSQPDDSEKRNGRARDDAARGLGEGRESSSAIIYKQVIVEWRRRKGKQVSPEGPGRICHFSDGGLQYIVNFIEYCMFCVADLSKYAVEWLRINRIQRSCDVMVVEEEEKRGSIVAMGSLALTKQTSPWRGLPMPREKWWVNELNSLKTLAPLSRTKPVIVGVSVASYSSLFHVGVGVWLWVNPIQKSDDQEKGTKSDDLLSCIQTRGIEPLKQQLPVL
ncbi:hypothetical protein R3P38DRAFT_2811440 [Favolaschia claudopus]|uniref:Uncharacterized protein n=1 Tax=Favolaschia claudopus TaxID=2862362 RepID=A0AAV9Z9J0_9AGAR